MRTSQRGIGWRALAGRSSVIVGLLDVARVYGVVYTVDYAVNIALRPYTRQVPKPAGESVQRRGDPRSQSSPSAERPLTRERVLRVAVELADRGGIEALSMRKLGQELGVDAMALYRHVRNKDDLLDGIVEVDRRRDRPAAPGRGLEGRAPRAGDGGPAGDAPPPVGAAGARGARHRRAGRSWATSSRPGDPARRRVLARPRPPHAARAGQPDLRVQPGPVRGLGRPTRRRRRPRSPRAALAASTRASPSWRVGQPRGRPRRAATTTSSSRSAST